VAPWRDAVERSLLAIKLLAETRAGAVAAVDTTSLLGVVGGERNYGSRFIWVRDLRLALDALIAVGIEKFSSASVTWLLGAMRDTDPRIDPMYGLGRNVVRSQRCLSLPDMGSDFGRGT
jgi:GH15 family glucan-1,4-alpha-glucosidase